MAKAKRSASEQLNDAVEVVMKDPRAPLPNVDAKLTELLRVAADLRDLPDQTFKARLKADLQRGEAPIRVHHVPAGHHSATACLVVRDAPRAIEFYKRVFGATELMRLADPNGMIVHAEVQIGDSPIAIAEEVRDWHNLSPQSLGGSPVVMQLYVEDVDAVASQAVEAGATIVFPVADQFYGDRSGRIADPFGHVWILATHKEDVTVEEMRRRAEAWTEQQGPQQAHAEAAPRQALVPYLQVQGADRLIDFLQQAFGGQELMRETLPDGSVCHAEVRIGDTQISMAEASAEYPPTQAALHLYVEDADRIYAQALRAGATSTYAPTDQPYGDREAGIKDAFGNSWYIATHQGDAEGRTHVPAGLRSVTPYLHPHGASDMIEFLKQVFDAEETFAHRSPSGAIEHAKMRIGDSILEMGEAHGPYQPLPTAIHLYVSDADATYQRALAAGADSLFAPVDKEYGQRLAGVKDRFGTIWYIATPKKE
jgi:PhnB protein